MIDARVFCGLVTVDSTLDKISIKNKHIPYAMLQKLPFCNNLSVGGDSSNSRQ
jgi:hypothetical protein